MFWIEAIGFLGSFLTVLAYMMKAMLWLGVTAVLSCVCFVIYGALIGSLPLIFMELTLLPINAWRLFEPVAQPPWALRGKPSE